MLLSRATESPPKVTVDGYIEAMKKVYGIVGIAALVALGGCQSAASNSLPPTETITVEEPAPEPPPEAEPEPLSEVDQYLYDIRGEMDFGNLVLRGAPYAGTSDSDLLRAGYAFCDYVEGQGEDVNYRLAVTMTSVLDFPETVTDAEDGNTVKVAAVATKHFCPEHAELMSEWMENFEG